MDIYTMVTDRIIALLEQGIIPWHKPWAGCFEGSFNYVSKKPYSILNQLLLMHEGEYASFKQWSELGGKVKKGAKSEIVVFWKLNEKVEMDSNGDCSIKYVPVLRYHPVFHISNVEGVEPIEKTHHYPTDPIQKAEETLNSYIQREGIKLLVGDSNRAFYRKDEDMISLPSIAQFEKAEEFYSTAFHECAHSTMKKARCDREADNKRNHFGDENYSKEELVAEISSAAILHSLGIETNDSFTNSAAYIQDWLHALEDDKRLIVSASSKAEKAAKYILGQTAETDNTEI